MCRGEALRLHAVRRLRSALACVGKEVALSRLDVARREVVERRVVSARRVFVAFHLRVAESKLARFCRVCQSLRAERDARSCVCSVLLLRCHRPFELFTESYWVGAEHATFGEADRANQSSKVFRLSSVFLWRIEYLAHSHSGKCMFYSVKTF